MGNTYTYQYDIHKKEIVKECNLYPTEICKSKHWPWLYARNNKYSIDSKKVEKIGKWMLFIPKYYVNTIWDKVKTAVTNGELWDSKVSTSDPERLTHAIMIYTKDYTDVEDIIQVLDYLESSGIKSPKVTAYYKTDKQTHAGIYSGGDEKPWIYSSDTIRETVVTKFECSSDSVTNVSNTPTYQFDILKKELVSACNLNPTDVCQSDDWPWLFAKNNKYSEECIIQEKLGKWMLFIPQDRINAIWDKIKIAVTNGELWNSKVSTANPEGTSHAVMVYTKDYTDLEDVIRVLNYLESSGIKSPKSTAYYKTDQQTRLGVYTGGNQKPWIYSSDTIRGTTSNKIKCECDLVSNMGNIATYQFDIHKKELVTGCNLLPADICQCDHWPWLYAKNNKYSDGSINQEKVGKWILFKPKDSINSIWDKIKTAVTNGDLWSSKVSTADAKKVSHVVMIYTKDYSDLEDVIRVLNFLESFGIKLPKEISYYKTEQQTRAGIYSGGKEKPWIYYSESIRGKTDSECTCKPLSYVDNVATFLFDIHKQEVITDCKLYPTEVNHCNHWPWLYARNNKYEYVNPEQIGKWMLFLSSDKVNAIWDKIKTAVTNGELWYSKVSTTNIETLSHVVMIYTTDYSDIYDVRSVLDYLESSGIKPPKVTIYYKTEQQTRAGIYSGGDRRPWIYSSATINKDNYSDDDSD